MAMWPGWYSEMYWSLAKKGILVEGDICLYFHKGERVHMADKPYWIDKVVSLFYSYNTKETTGQT